MKPNTHERLVHQYLLGDLPEEEQLALERDYFADSEVFERVWEIENDLVDRYVRGRLNREDRKLFEENYLASPVHRERVRVATALLEQADSRADRTHQVGATVSRRSWLATFLDSMRVNSWQWATIAAIALLVGLGVVLLIERTRWHRQIDQLKAETLSEQRRSQELEREIAAQRDQNDKLAGDLARLYEEQRNAEPTSQLPKKEVRSVLSLLLSPMLMRSEGETPQLKLTKETAAVLLKMRVQRTEAKAYRVDLRTVEGVSVWSASSIEARAKDRSMVSVTIPASKLAASDYILTLSATNSANETEEINRYFLRISKE
jgi:hypothetical protein